MNGASAWDVYMSMQNKNNNNNTARLAVPLQSVAEEFGLSPAMAEEYAILLHMLNLVEFDAERKEILNAA